MGGGNSIAVCVLHCVFKQSQLVLTRTEDPLIPAAAPNSQGVILEGAVRHRSPVLTFDSAGFMFLLNSAVSLKRSPCPTSPPFVFSANEILMRGPGLIYSFTIFHSASLPCSPLLFCLLFSRFLYLVYHHFSRW